jgi:hypothetical protein
MEEHEVPGMLPWAQQVSIYVPSLSITLPTGWVTPFSTSMARDLRKGEDCGLSHSSTLPLWPSSGEGAQRKLKEGGPTVWPHLAYLAWVGTQTRVQEGREYLSGGTGLYPLQPGSARAALAPLQPA